MDEIFRRDLLPRQSRVYEILFDGVPLPPCLLHPRREGDWLERKVYTIFGVPPICSLIVSFLTAKTRGSIVWNRPKVALPPNHRRDVSIYGPPPCRVWTPAAHVASCEALEMTTQRFSPGSTCTGNGKSENGSRESRALCRACLPKTSVRYLRHSGLS